MVLEDRIEFDAEDLLDVAVRIGRNLQTGQERGLLKNGRGEHHLGHGAYRQPGEVVVAQQAVAGDGGLAPVAQVGLGRIAGEGQELAGFGVHHCHRGAEGRLACSPQRPDVLQEPLLDGTLQLGVEAQGEIELVRPPPLGDEIAPAALAPERLVERFDNMTGKGRLRHLRSAAPAAVDRTPGRDHRRLPLHQPPQQSVLRAARAQTPAQLEQVPRVQTKMVANRHSLTAHLDFGSRRQTPMIEQDRAADQVRLAEKNVPLPFHANSFSRLALQSQPAVGSRHDHLGDLILIAHAAGRSAKLDQDAVAAKLAMPADLGSIRQKPLPRKHVGERQHDVVPVRIDGQDLPVVDPEDRTVASVELLDIVPQIGRAVEVRYGRRVVEGGHDPLGVEIEG